MEAPHRLGQTRLSPVQQVWARRERARLAGGAAVIVAAYVAASLRIATAEVRALGVAPLALLVGGSALYATSYAEGAGAGLWLFLPGVVLMHLLAARVLTARPTKGHRVFAAVATLALGYLSLWWVDGLHEVGL